MSIELAPDVRYDPDTKGYVMLQVPAPELPALELDGAALNPKPEFHCSLVPVRKLADGDPVQEAALVQVIQSQLAIKPVRFKRFTNEIYVCSKADETGAERLSVIAGVELVGLKGLRRALKQSLPGYKPPFPHVTLYASDQYGIGVNSDDELAEYCQRRDDLRAVIFPEAD